MTGSDSSGGSCKGSRRPRFQKHELVHKSELTPTADNLRRLAIKNSYGNKSLPVSPLLSRVSSAGTTSTTPLKSASSLKTAEIKMELAQEREKGLNSTLQPLPSDADVQQKATTSYITRQELLHSLKRTSSNFSVGQNVTHTTACSGNSSYIYHTPRHLARTNFHTKPLPRSAITTPDCELEKLEVKRSDDKCRDYKCSDENSFKKNIKKRSDGEEDGGCLETKMRLLPPSRALPLVRASSSQRPGFRKQAPLCPGGKSLQYLGLEFPTLPDKQGRLSGKVFQNYRKNMFQDTQISSQHESTSCEDLIGATEYRVNCFTRKSLMQYNHLPVKTLPQHSLPPCSHLPHMTGSAGMFSRQIPIALAKKKVTLHVPQGRKTASLV